WVMQPRAVVTRQAMPNEVLQVRFIPRTSARAVAPPPELSIARPTPSKTRLRWSAPAKRPAISPPPASTETTTAVHLYDRDGQLLLPASTASVAATPNYVPRKLQGDTQIMRHSDPIKYKATTLDAYFPPPGESAGGAAVRRTLDTLIKTKDVNLPGGLHLKCKTILGIPTPNCIDPPAPPSAKDGDERLNMAPAKPLAADPHAPKPPTVAACIAMYRAGKPLQHGCPVDTPNRAVDAELRQRAEHMRHQR
ncbi:MAG: hypothetical protein ACTS5I_08620, partial [Rhodanobacter sp.]